MFSDAIKTNAKMVSVELERVLSHPRNRHELYVYHEGCLYVRTSGHSIEIVNSELPMVDWYDLVGITINAQDASELWIAFGPHGLYHSTDGGRSFSCISGVEMAESIRFTELEKNFDASAALVLKGRLDDGRRGTFYSINGGMSWGELSAMRVAPIPTGSDEWDLTLSV